MTLNFPPMTQLTAEIKSAYRDAMKRCHPDVAGEHASEASALLNRAWYTLKAGRCKQQPRLESAWYHKFTTSRRGTCFPTGKRDFPRALHSYVKDPARRAMYDSGRVLFGESSLFASFTAGAAVQARPWLGSTTTLVLVKHHLVSTLHCERIQHNQCISSNSMNLVAFFL